MNIEDKSDGLCNGESTVKLTQQCDQQKHDNKQVRQVNHVLEVAEVVNRHRQQYAETYCKHQRKAYV